MTDESTLTQLLHFLATSFERKSDQILLERFGIGFAQYKILLAMQLNPSVGQRELADSLVQTEASVSRQIKLLKRKGMIVSQVNPKNRRQHLSFLTPQGSRLREVAFDTLDELSLNFFSNLDNSSKQNLLSLLEKTRTSLLDA